VPGYFRAGEHEGQALPGWRVRWDDDGGADERRLLGRWAAENTKRYLAAMVAVGTVDQAMLAALQVKQAHLRSAALNVDKIRYRRRESCAVGSRHPAARWMVSRMIEPTSLEPVSSSGSSAALKCSTANRPSTTRATTISRAAIGTNLVPISLDIGPSQASLMKESDGSQPNRRQRS